jgi:membrane associated rhomboid family serine protease
MLIIPLGNENNMVRRHPWVTYGLLAANFVVFVLTVAAGPGQVWESRFNAKFDEIVEHISERPYLELKKDLAVYCNDACEESLQEARREAVARGRVPARIVVLEEQQKLDRLVHELVQLRRSLPTFRHGFVPARPTVASLLTYMFLHASWLHLLGNLLFLFISGPFIEDLYGRVLFSVLYIVTGCLAALAHAAYFPDSVTPLVGASGAIAGVMGAFLVRLTWARIRFIVFPVAFLPFFRFHLSLPAVVVLPLWVGEQLVYAQYAGSRGGVAWWAHVGGFAAGMVLAGLVRVSRVEDRFIHPGIEKSISIEQHPDLEAALEARLAGRLDEARRRLGRLLAAEPGHLDALRLQYDVEEDAGRDGEAGQAAARLLDAYLRQDERELATGLIKEVCRLGKDGVPVRFYLSAGGLLERLDDLTLALRSYQLAAERFPADPGAFRAHFRRGEILKRLGETAAARQALVLASGHPACFGPLKEAVDKSLAQLSPVDQAEGSRSPTTVTRFKS